MDKIDLIKSLEWSFFDSNVRTSIEKLNELIADDFIEYGSSGKIYNKQKIINMLLNVESPCVKLDNFKIKTLSVDILLVNYFSEIRYKNNQVEKALRTSIWKFYGDKWKIMFHQGTPTEM